MTLQPDMMALHQAHSHFQQQHKQSLPTVEHDPAWPSPCEVGEPSKLNEIKWHKKAPRHAAWLHEKIAEES